MKLFYNIRQVCKITNIPASTLRNWEARYEFIKPKRNEEGTRIYTKDDIEILKKIVANLKTGLTIGEINKSILNGDKLAYPFEASINLNESNILIIENYYRALINLDLNELSKQNELIELSFDLENRIDYVYGPILERIGEDWSNNKISVAEEHFSSNYIRRHLLNIIGSSPQSPSLDKPYIICSTPSNELHEGGALLIGSKLKLLGFNIIYLGPNLPILELIKTASRFHKCYVVLSISDPELIEKSIEELVHAPFNVFIGGKAVSLSDLDFVKKGSVQIIRTTGRKSFEDLLNLISMDN